MLNIDDAWESFLSNEYTINSKVDTQEIDIAPTCGELYISTKTKIAYLNQEIPLDDIFWNIPIIKYQDSQEGILKKQMKVSCLTKNESDIVDAKIAKVLDDKNLLIMDQLQKIDNPTARKIKYKDIRKINIGLSKKDLISFRVKKRGAFYNCFVLILRIKENDTFREIHVKVFNTGKLEIPGIQQDSTLYITLDLVIKLLKSYCPKHLSYDKSKISTVLINSNFTCNHFIKRQVLADILKYEYKIHVVCDPCSYPGIQCKFYYNKNNPENNGVCQCKKRCNKKGKGNGDNDCLEISFMIFRTGSILIVGHCNEFILNIIYNFLRNMLEKEYSKINAGLNLKSKSTQPKKKRKRVLLFTNQ